LLQPVEAHVALGHFPAGFISFKLRRPVRAGFKAIPASRALLMVYQDGSVFIFFVDRFIRAGFNAYRIFNEHGGSIYAASYQERPFSH
jgi:hypothetical protein